MATKIKTPGKIVIGGLLIVGIFFGAKHFMGDKAISFGSEKTETVTNTTVPPNKYVTETKSVETLKDSKATSKFAYTPAEPVNGTLYGIIEVGASGFNGFVIEMDKDKNYRVITKKFGNSFSNEGLANKESLRDQLQTYLQDIFRTGVNGKTVQTKNVHFVLSSGAQKSPNTVGAAKLLEKQYTVNYVTAEQEGKGALRAVLPKEFENNSWVFDMGSGNGKVSWMENGKIVTYETPGAKYFQKGMNDADAYEQVKAAVSKVPQDKRSQCFIIGGIPFDLAKRVRDGEERYTVLNAPEYYTTGSDAKMASGLNIYKALIAATGTRVFVFDWDANFTFGYLMSWVK